MPMFDLPRVTWRKSSRSKRSGGARLDVVSIGPAIVVCAGEDLDSAKPTFAATTWSGSARPMKAGYFHLP